MTDRKNIARNFASRLVRLLIEHGHASRSSSTGVKVSMLAKKAGCSFQMASRYVKGEALPDALAIQHIAKWLNVDPGWLLFGNHQESKSEMHEPITLAHSDLKLLFERIIPVYIAQQYADEKNIPQLHDFFCEVITDFSRLHAPQEHKIRILETSISSALHFIPRLTERKRSTIK